MAVLIRASHARRPPTPPAAPARQRFPASLGSARRLPAPARGRSELRPDGRSIGGVWRARAARAVRSCALLAGDGGGGEIGSLGEGRILGVSFQLDVSAEAMQETVRPMFPKGAHMTEKPSEAYLAGYFFGREGRRTERRFDEVGVELKAYREGFVDGRRTARAAEDWRKAIEHQLGLGLHWHDRLNIQNPQVSDPGASIDPD